MLEEESSRACVETASSHFGKHVASIVDNSQYMSKVASRVRIANLILCSSKHSFNLKA